MATRCVRSMGVPGLGLDILNYEVMDKAKYNPLDLLMPPGMAQLALHSGVLVLFALPCPAGFQSGLLS